MSDIRIERQHQLGLPRARRVATDWMAQARERWGLQFDHEQAKDASPDATDHIRFSGMGAEGTVEVSASRFAVDLALGGLMSALAPMIEEKMTRNLDEFLAREAAAGG